MKCVGSSFKRGHNVRSLDPSIRGWPGKCKPGCTCKRHIGRPLSAEACRRISLAKLGDRNPMRRPEVAARSGANNPRRRSDDQLVLEQDYGKIHGRLRKRYPKTGVCEECGKNVGTSKATGTEYAYRFHPLPYTLDREDYRELCVKCHRRLDASTPRDPGGSLDALAVSLVATRC